MSVNVVRSFCRDCGQLRPFDRPKLNWLLHVVLFIVTFGFWLLVVILLVLCRPLVPFRCRECGRRKHFLT